MKKFSILMTLCIIWSMSSYSSTVLHVFGDSLSDQGHAPIFDSGELAKVGATFTNKVSDKPGKVWVSYLSNLIGTAEPQPRFPIWKKYYHVDDDDGTGFAVAGYTTDNIYSSIVDRGHYQKVSQTGMKGLSVFYSKEYFTVNDGYLHTNISKDSEDVIATLWGGGNDLLHGSSPVLTADNLMKSVKTLYNQGNIKCLIVLDMPDLGSLPINYIISKNRDVPIINFNAERSKISDQFNSRMSQSIELLRDKVQFIQISKLFSDVLKNPEKFGFSSTNQSKYCINPITEPYLPSVPCTQHPQGDTNLVFNDGIHPSTKMHELIANFVYSQVKSETSCKAGGPF